jgi:hypothetical protein
MIAVSSITVVSLKNLVVEKLWKDPACCIQHYAAVYNQ